MAVDDEENPAAWLGRRCAEVGLNLAAAKMVFETLYAASAMVRSSNNISEAARIAGCDRVTIHRLLKKGKSPDDVLAPNFRDDDGIGLQGAKALRAVGDGRRSGGVSR